MIWAMDIIRNSNLRKAVLSFQEISCMSLYNLL